MMRDTGYLGGARLIVENRLWLQRVQEEKTRFLPQQGTRFPRMSLRKILLSNSLRRSAGRAASSRGAASSHAPSFHSAVESFSDTRSFAPDKRSFIRTPTLTTLGSQTPKPSSTPRTYSSRSIRKPSFKVRLSSPFARPSFPLEAIELDLKNIPIFAAGSEHSVTDDEAGGSPASAETFIDEKTAHKSILVEFTPGIRGYCTAVAIKAVGQLLDCIQAKVSCMCLRVRL